jgi:Na+/H+-translocating membrane pyrophosphatase
MVDPTTDPVDYAAVASGQPGNVGMEMAAQATAQAQAAADQAAQQAMANTGQ